MRNEKELVSVIMPAYNSALYIAESIQSVISQTYPAWELIIVDDCSTDETCRIVEEIAQGEPRIQLARAGTNAGAGAARNIAISMAQGRFIAFLDSDDQWLPHKLEKQVRFMREKQAVLSYASYRKHYSDGKRRDVTVRAPEVLTYKDILKTCSIGCLTAMYDAKALGKVYMPHIRRRQDYALWLEILRPGARAYGLDEPLAVYRVRKTSISNNKLIAALYQWRTYREIERLGFWNSVRYFVMYSYHGVKKRLPGRRVL